MLGHRLYIKFNRKANRFYSLILVIMVFVFNGCSANHRGDLTFKESSADSFNISGKIILTDIIETDSARASLATLSDFSYFLITAGEVTARADRSGNFSLAAVGFSDSLVIKAISNKIGLLRRVTADELCYSDLSSIEIDLKSTAEALVYQQGILLKKDLTPADIRAREYEEDMEAIISALKLSMQLPKASIPSTELELPVVVQAAKSLAQKCVSRDATLKEANTVLRHAFLREDLDIIKLYISPSFGNDWDSSSSWEDFTTHFANIFAKNDFTNLTWEILDTELLAENKARIRTKVSCILKNSITEEIVCNKSWTFDAMWREEGSIWKLYRNIPYKDTHPTQADADRRWGEIASAFAELQRALFQENINVISNRVSEVFRNEFDGTSTKNELLFVTTRRFNTMDIKITDYSIDSIRFTANDCAEVDCSGRIKLINLADGIDIDSGYIQCRITWHKEGGVWRIYGNLPYKFTHRLTIN